MSDMPIDTDDLEVKRSIEGLDHFPKCSIREVSDAYAQAFFFLLGKRGDTLIENEEEQKEFDALSDKGERDFADLLKLPGGDDERSVGNRAIFLLYFMVLRPDMFDARMSGDEILEAAREARDRRNAKITTIHG